VDQFFLNEVWILDQILCLVLTRKDLFIDYFGIKIPTKQICNQDANIILLTDKHT